MIEAIRTALDRGADTFAALSRIEGFAGPYQLMCDQNLVVWRGVSEEACEALNHLLAAKEIHYKPTSPAVYAYYGIGLVDLPIARGFRPYKRPHWLPVLLKRGPLPGKKKPLGEVMPLSKAPQHVE
jgi:hypothetical protein